MTKKWSLDSFDNKPFNEIMMEDLLFLIFVFIILLT